MAYQVLARKYRPQSFSDVAGQEHVTRTLLNALEQGRIAHGYIFSGHRGIGKTTVARILSMALNCRTPIGTAERPSPEPCGVCVSCEEIRAGNSVDMLEIDAATNRGIDEIRELRDAARYRPARDRYKIYLLDEAHQITDAAFNALLKILEEPPDHVVFMMATTQPEDLPQTIRSRCQHFSFHAVKFEDILAQLRQIVELEGIAAEDAALALLAEAGDGSMRDALSIMDQAIASAPLIDGRAKLEAEQILELMGAVPNPVFERLLEEVHANRSAAVIEQINGLINAGNSPSQLARQLVRYLRNALMAKLGGETTELLQISADERARAARSAALFSEEDLTRFLQVMLNTFNELNYRQEQRFHLELGLLKIVHLQRLIPLEQILGSLPGMSTPPAASGTPRQISSPIPPQISQRSVPSQAFPNPPAQPEAAMPVSPELIAPRSTTQELDSADVDVEDARQAVVAALDAGGHKTAAALLSAGRWTVESDGAIQAEVGIKATMLSLTMNAEAWKIAREALTGVGVRQKLTVIPGSGIGGAAADEGAPRASLPSISGSIQAVAMENPLVRRAQELFPGEVRSVLDLRERSQGNSRNNR